MGVGEPSTKKSNLAVILLLLLAAASGFVFVVAPVTATLETQLEAVTVQLVLL